MQYLYLLVVSLLITASQYAYSEVYVTTDENGVKHYSDTPSPNAKKIAVAHKTTIIETSNNTAPKKEVVLLADDEDVEESAPAIVQTIQIAQPTNEATIRNNNGTVNVSLDIMPAELNEGDTIELYLDGELHTQQIELSSFTLLNVFRGAHTIHVSLLNNKGTVIAKSDEITFFMHRNRQQSLSR